MRGEFVAIRRTDLALLVALVDAVAFQRRGAGLGEAWPVSRDVRDVLAALVEPDKGTP